MPTDLTTIIETVAVTQFLTPAAKNLGETVLERGRQMVGKAAAYLTAVGRQPRPVEEKLFVPMLQGAGLESDPTLADLWAALLANAADPAQHAAVHPSYADVLRQLSSDDAQMLSFINKYYEYERGSPWLHPPDHDDAISYFSWPNMRSEASIDNLLRLRLCVYEDYNYLVSIDAVETTKVYTLPTYGAHFLAAVTPPTP